MCGIVGYLGIPLSAEERIPFLRRMCDAIVHRGPDDDGYYADGRAGLGMRRLSIIDLSSGHQPIANEDGSKQIVFNGEIYNYQELRPQLKRQGHRFQTQSDTEVILRQYEQDGAACVHKFNGMFAFAIWDDRTKTLFMARDRMGVKPLYYYWDGRHFLFASEIKALLATGIPARELNEQALWDYLTFRYVPQPQTIWRNIHKLPPGHSLTISLENPEPRPVRYWDIPYTDRIQRRSESELLGEFEELFVDAVRLRLIADVPVGILLSGGLDSSAVAAALGELHNAQLNSFSVAFKDSPNIDELPYARQVARHVGLTHHEVVIGEKEFLDFLPRFAYFADEPLADLASIPLYYVSQLARTKIKVALSGEGSDEILGGYNLDVYVKQWDQNRLWQKLPARFRGEIAPKFAQRLGPKWVERLYLANIPRDLRFLPARANMTDHLTSEAKRALFRTNGHHADSLDLVRAELDRAGSRDPLHQLLYVFSQSWLVEDLLMKADKMSMANSIELRTPFLDYRLVEWAARAPSHIKIGRNKDGKYETKRVLRQFAYKRLPKEIIERPKMGFPVPLYDWLPTRLKSWTFDLLGSPNAMLHRWLDPAAVRAQLEAGTQPDAGVLDRHRLWDLLIFEIWSREWQPH
jgi:asparagine synthase (glutamine-hydrolysing)